MMITELLAKTVVKMVARQFKLDKILSYVEDPNDADKRIDELELDVFGMKQNVKHLSEVSHEPRDFVICNECKEKIKEKK
tara:strand:- start:260 stop:499 length:240 start_codon:yes stop_codon:yes gene_type:complete